ncbi:DUF5994 family protein [Nocardia sp. JMUB6875]|uniref:DUF5994 family protein n=1 Tax=Nocardia sp. JMUB6875 TaxID=3158170 RepID=UPI0034E86218
MTLPWTTVYGPRHTGPHPLRLSLRDPAAPKGPVDGAWWPRSKQPAAELHELIAAVATRLGSMVRVGFDWRTNDPDSFTRRGTAAVATTSRAAIMYLFGSNGARLDVLVIPADTRPDAAAAQMRWASGKPQPSPTARPRAPEKHREVTKSRPRVPGIGA